MGKVKKEHPKVHKSKSGTFIESSIVKKVSPLKIKKPQKPIEKNVLSSKLKSNLNLKQMNSKLEVKSTLNKSGHISKKNKIKEKRKSLINKIDLLKQAKKEVLAQKKRQRTAIIGDLMPLKDALPSLDSLFLLKQSLDIKTGVPEFDEEMDVPEKSKQRLKKEKMRNVAKEHNKRLNYYQRLIADDTFKKNPREVIAAHIRNTKLFEEQADQFNNN